MSVLGRSDISDQVKELALETKAHVGNAASMLGGPSYVIADVREALTAAETSLHAAIRLIDPSRTAEVTQAVANLDGLLRDLPRAEVDQRHAVLTALNELRRFFDIPSPPPRGDQS